MLSDFRVEPATVPARAWSSLSIERRSAEGDRVVLAVAGDVDRAAGEQLRRAILAAAEEASAVEVDLGCVDFLEPDVAEAVAALGEELAARGAHLELSAATGCAARALAFIGPDDTLIAAIA